MHTNQLIREHLVKFLLWEDAHCGFNKAVEGLPSQLRGVAPPGLPYSAWQLVEHLRIAQRDILDFTRDSKYVERNWPNDYWPGDVAPPNETAWDASISAFHADRAEFGKLLSDPKIDLLAPAPTGIGQTLLRELLLAADHNAYHIGQLVYVRRLLGAWNQ